MQEAGDMGEGGTLAPRFGMFTTAQCPIQNRVHTLTKKEKDR